MLLRAYIPILLIFLIQAKQTSPLRYAYDATENEINLQFTSQKFLLTLSSSIQFEEVRFCFRQRPVTNNDEMNTCSLGNSQGTYDCLTINLILHAGIYWRADSELVATGPEKVFSFSYFLNSTTSIYSLDGKLDGNETFSFLSEKNTIYEIVALPQQYPPNRAYTQTFSASDHMRTDNILFQRQVICTADKDINHLLFLGGVIRNEDDVYMAAFLVYSRTDSQFSYWGGLSFSSDKSSRDMLGVFPEQDMYADLYSLYAAAPYKDLSTNINGTQDWTQIASSFQASQGQKHSYYYMSMYRLYNTANPKGDEAIITKINNKFCYVAWTSSTVDLFGVEEPYVENYMHTVLNCFVPDITLYSELLAFSLILMILFNLHL